MNEGEKADNAASSLGAKEIARSKGEDPAERFPCIIASPRHFHLFVRNKDDAWSPTIEELNRGSYDPTKLKRISFYLNVGIRGGSPMGFAFDGSMLAPRNPHIRNADDAIDEFNRVIGALVLGGLHLDHVTPKELAFGSLLTTGYFRYEMPHGVLPRLHQAWSEASAGGYLNIDLLDPLRITRDEVERAWARGRPVLDAAHNLDPSAMIMAFSYHYQTEYRNSLIYSWLAIEQLIEQIWDDYFVKRVKIDFSERLGTLNRIARNISGKIEFLVEANIIEKKLYAHLSSARSARNDFIHAGKKPEQKDSFNSLNVLISLLGIIALQRDIDYKPAVLRKISKGRRGGRGLGVSRAETIDWGKVRLWRAIKPIPGEAHWVGDYEDFYDIRLQRVEPDNY